MDISHVIKYEETRIGDAKLEFADGTTLLLVPYMYYSNIKGFDSALLYQQGTLEALATERPSRYARPEESGFWSRGKITQQQLAEYMLVAAQVGEKISDDYNAGKMREDTWVSKFLGFWQTIDYSQRLRDSLESGRERVFDKNPERFNERI